MTDEFKTEQTWLIRETAIKVYFFQELNDETLDKLRAAGEVDRHRLINNMFVEAQKHATEHLNVMNDLRSGEIDHALPSVVAGKSASGPQPL